MGKIKPSDQTKTLSRARWEMLLRNDKAREAFENQSFIKSFRKWFDEHPGIFDYASECDDVFERIQCGRAVGENEALRHLFLQTCFEGGDTWETYRQKAREPGNSARIAQSLTTGDIANKLIVEIDLTRPKEVIFAELGALLERKHRGTDKRLKWLPIVGELLRVWDLRIERKAFADIAIMTGTSEDTAKKRFYSAFELIHRTPYDKDMWKKLFREHFEKLLRNRPADEDLWKYVASLEERAAQELPSDAEPVAGADELTMGLILADLEKICATCPDAVCRATALPCFQAMATGDDTAFDEFKPDCPTLFTYLTQ